MRKHKHDYDKIIRFYQDGDFYCKGFTKYSAAYVITNEDLRVSTGLSDLKGANVLTVAASGDHPIFYKLGGAAHVDTFDISFCAKAIMDIKTAAIPVLARFEYVKLIDRLHYNPRIRHVQNFAKIQSAIPAETQEFIQSTPGCRLFSRDCPPTQYASYLPDKQEYSQLKKLINEPFGFIWTGVDNLHKHLAKKYDVINLSNIFNYIPEFGHQMKILQSLEPYLSPGGMIVVYTHIRYNGLERAAASIADWAKCSHIERPHTLSGGQQRTGVMVFVVQKRR